MRMLARQPLMKAALIGADRALTVADIERPAPAVGEVLIDVRYCGICGSDLHMLGMPADLVPAGHVLGHELTGVVAALGPGVTGWSASERVVVHPMAGRIPCDRIITKVGLLDSAPAIVAELHGGATDHVKVLLTPSEPT
jgi:threonine dehydrogenase-like Zn-dependent dehydrogenase